MVTETDVGLPYEKVHQKAQTLQTARPVKDSRTPTSSHSKSWFLVGTTDFNRFPFNNFTYYFTLFSKFFSSFPHGTCSLSVSRLYLALDETYHPFRAAIPNNSTRWTYIVRWKLWIVNGALTLNRVSFQRTYTQVSADSTSLGYNSMTRLGNRFSNWALPASLAVTKGILVSFFSSP